MLRRLVPRLVEFPGEATVRIALAAEPVDVTTAGSDADRRAPTGC